MKEINILTRHDGSQVKIVAELCSSPSGEISINNYGFHRSNEKDNWRLCESPTKTGPMSRADYMQYGRPELFKLTNPGEILKTNMALMTRARTSEPLALVN